MKIGLIAMSGIRVGEGDLYWQQLLRDAEGGRLQPFYGNIHDEFDLNDSPLPAYELLDIDKYHRLTIQTPFPGTPLYARLKDEGRVLSPWAWEKCTLFDINFSPRKMSVDVLGNGFKELVRNLHSEDFTRLRKQRFKENLKKPFF